MTNPTYTATTPAGLATLPTLAGTGTTGNPGNGCPTGTTRLAWNTGLLQAGSPVLLGYEVTVDVSATGGETYTNVATVSGNSLAVRASTRPCRAMRTVAPMAPPTT